MTVKSLLINEADRPAQRAGSPLLESAISPENPIYQGDLAGTADTAGDASTRNDSATARADTGNIRGICSPGVPAAETADDRLDKIEAMVTDLFRQLRNERQAIGGFGQLVDNIAARVEYQQAVITRHGQRLVNLQDRVSKLEIGAVCDPIINGVAAPNLADDGAEHDRRRRLACIQIPDITEGEGL